MIPGLDTDKNFLRRRLTLVGALEAFIDPLVALLTLQACLLAFDQALTPRYVMLGILTFSLAFPGKASLHEAPRRVVRKVISNWLVCLAVLALFGILTGYTDAFRRPILITWAIATPIAQLAAHAVVRTWLLKWVQERQRKRRAVIIGVNGVGVRLARQFADNPHLNTQLLGFFDDRAPGRLEGRVDAPMLGPMQGIAAQVKRDNVDEIYIALPMASQPRILQLLDDLKDTTASVYFVPDIFMTDLVQGHMVSVGSMPALAVCETPFYGVSGAAKRASDIVIATLLLLLVAPVMLVVALGVKLGSPGPVIFKQRRYGLDGQEILVYKFRSMTTTDNGSEVKQATRNDKRITPLGAILRKTSLDELPQLINVLQGRMSIVGPRPHAVAHNEMYRKVVKGYMVRHKVRPGITGWAQVSGYRGETDTVDKMAKRIEYDLEYLRNWSLAFDLWIIVKTVLVVFNDKTAY